MSLEVLSEESSEDSSRASAMLFFQCEGVVLVIKSSLLITHLLVTGFSKAIAGKAYPKINLLAKTPLHRRSMEVRRSGFWAPGNRYFTSLSVEVVERVV